MDRRRGSDHAKIQSHKEALARERWALKAAAESGAPGHVLLYHQLRVERAARRVIIFGGETLERNRFARYFH